MTEAQLRQRIRDIRGALKYAPYGSRAEYVVETELDHYSMRLANVQAGHGDTAVLTGAKVR